MAFFRSVGVGIVSNDLLGLNALKGVLNYCLEYTCVTGSEAELGLRVRVVSVTA